MIDIAADVQRAAGRIYRHVRRTPLDHSVFFSRQCGAEVFLKLENLQHTGSFKLRGAFNKMLTLDPAQRSAGCVVASTGNHRAATAYAMAELGVNGVIFVPEDISSTKLDAIRRLGARVELHGDDGAITESHARDFAGRNGMVYVSPYNDTEVIAGQGTIGFELAEQLQGLDAVLASVGGGGLISGVGAYLKSLSPDLKLIGCLPENSPVMARSIEAGRVLEVACTPTLSDGTAGGLEPGAITFELCQELVDDYVLVSEDEIKVAMREFMAAHHMLLEGAAGVALAGLAKVSAQLAGQRVAVIICGANISLDVLKAVL